jgi:NADH-quinone oxidoreductase subunit L
MVTAGIYLITRSHALYALAPFSQTVVALVGAATALWAATIAVGQFDIKRVLAYSTISQLGFMIAAVGLGGYVAGMFHLIMQAFFKALLFLSAGSIIQAVERGQANATHAARAVGGGGHDHDVHDRAHAAHGEDHHAEDHGPDPQDMRNMGGLWARLPVTKWVFLIGALAMAGIPPLSAFWSKDEILLDAFKHNLAIYLLLTIAAFFTAFYTFRQVLMVFFGQPRTDAARHATDSPRVMTIPLIVLAFLSFFGGALNLPSIAGYTPPGAHALTRWLGHTLEAGHGSEAAAVAEAQEATGTESESEGAMNFMVAGLSTGLAVAAIGLAYVLYRSRPAAAEERDPLQGMLGPVFTGMNRKWYVDEFYDLIILRPYNWLARISADVIDGRFWHDWFHDSVLAGLFNTFSRVLADGVDKGFVDPVISDFPADLSKGIAAFFHRVQTGFVRSYALAVFVGVVVVLGYFLIVR